MLELFKTKEPKSQYVYLKNIRTSMNLNLFIRFQQLVIHKKYRNNIKDAVMLVFLINVCLVKNKQL